MSDVSEVPVLDVSGLHGDEEAFAACAASLGDAARTIGFAQLVGHGVDPALFARLRAASAEFFALPDEAKAAVHIAGSHNHRGYVPIGEEVFAGGTPDQKEAFDLSFELPADDPRHLAGHPLLGPNRWPELPGFREAVTEWYDAVFALARRVLRAFAVALGEPADRFDRHVTAPPAQLRLIHYPYDAERHDRPGIGAHTDYECFTLLRPTAPGLQVMTAAGEWADVPFVHDAFVLNIGDLLETWTNGTFVATTHRVAKVAQERYSFPMFFTVDYDTVVTPLPGFVREGQEPMTPLHAGEHLFAQTAQSFRYLRERVDAGALTLPDGARPLSSFGRETRASTP